MFEMIRILVGLVTATGNTTNNENQGPLSQDINYTHTPKGCGKSTYMKWLVKIIHVL